MGTFSLAARHLECRGCGAPLAGASPGVRVSCEFCGVEYEIEDRSDDGRRALSAADDIARLSRLRGQLEHPIEGHLYDLDDIPPGASARGVSSARDLAALDRLWNELKPRAVAGQDSPVDQHALCWCAIRLAEQMIGSDPAAARVKLETSLDLLRDPGHRHLVRCALSEAAVDVGELDAADGWLRECDQAAEVLELDTALRHARVRVALARDQVGDALALVGVSKDAVPVAPEHALRFELARAHLDERAGQTGRARERVEQAVKDHGPNTIAWARRLSLAPASVHQVEQDQLVQECEKAQAALVQRTAWQPLLASGLIAGPLYTLVLTLLLGIVGCSTHKGPLLGLTASVVCPRSCETCEGPYTMQFWSTSNGSSSSSSHAVFCQTPSESAEAWDFSRRIQAKYEKHPQWVPGGTFTLWALSFLVLLPFAVIAGLIRAAVRRSREAGEVTRLRATIAQLQARLDVPVEPPTPTLIGALTFLAIACFVPVLLAAINLGLR